MKVLPVEKFIIYSIVIITLIFSFTLIRDYALYSDATLDIMKGEYTEAARSLDKLKNYRDAETLLAYCDIMSEYDPEDFKSIYHCYRELSELDLDNKALRDEFTKTTTEVKTLYYHYNISLTK